MCCAISLVPTPPYGDRALDTKEEVVYSRIQNRRKARMTWLWVLLLLYMDVCAQAVDVISTIAGTGTGGYSGDSGQATSAQLDSSRAVALDSSGYIRYICILFYAFLFYSSFPGNVYIVDYSNNVIRKVTKSTGIINTVVGDYYTSSYYYYSFNSYYYYSSNIGDGGLATYATLDHPHGLTLDSSGSAIMN